MPWLLVAVFMGGACFGFASTFAYDARRIAELKASIALSNQIADDLLEASLAAKAQADAEALAFNDTLEKTREQTITTINTYADQLHDRIAHRADALSNPVDTRIGETDGALGQRLSTADGHFLAGEAQRADLAVERANALLQLLQNNCGIQHER